MIRIKLNLANILSIGYTDCMIFEEYAFFIRKYINRKKSISLMHDSLKEGYKDFLERSRSDSFDYEGSKYKIIPVKTPLFKGGDDIISYMIKDILPNIESGDLVTIAESVIAVTEERAFRVEDIKPSKWAYLLYPWVSNVNYGTGLGMPETMQCAIDEIGLKRILKATLYGAADRIRKKHGSFYDVTGKSVKGIDFKKEHPIPFKGSHNYIVLSPKNPQEFSKLMFKALGTASAVVDANNVSVDILGIYPKNSKTAALAAYAMKGNPAGQDDEKTPIVIIRKITK